MKCEKCKAVNKNNEVLCKRCGEPLIKIWAPSWRWSIKVLVIIYLILVLFYFILKVVIK